MINQNDLLQIRIVRIIYKQSAIAHTRSLNFSILPVYLEYKHNFYLIARKPFHSTQTHS